MKISHIYTNQHNNPFVSRKHPHNSRVITMVTDITEPQKKGDSRLLFLGYAIKAPNMQFNKRISVSYATENMYKNHAVELPDAFKTFDHINLYSLMYMAYLVQNDKRISFQETKDEILDLIIRQTSRCLDHPVNPYTLFSAFSWAIGEFSKEPDTFEISMSTWWEEYVAVNNHTTQGIDFSTVQVK